MLDIHSNYLLIGTSPKRGRGIFARYDISAGIIIGLTPSWELSPNDITIIASSSIEGFWFDHPDKPGWGLLPLGVAALINYSQNPNSILEWHNSEQGYVGQLRSSKDITKGSEIYIDYNIIPPNDWV